LSSHVAAIQGLAESISNVQKSELPTIDAILAEKRARREAAAKAEAEKAALEATKPDPLFANDAVETAAAIPTESPAAALVAVDQEQEPEHTGSDIGDLEAEADQQGAFNPETGEINWDCPCLGGMAHGPCGPEFREAFSCFVYSKEEPKGMECIDKFKYVYECYWSGAPDVAELNWTARQAEQALAGRENSG
jgi:intermembrane space import and assembly protein 40